MGSPALVRRLPRDFRVFRGLRGSPFRRVPPALRPIQFTRSPSHRLRRALRSSAASARTPLPAGVLPPVFTPSPVFFRFVPWVPWATGFLGFGVFRGSPPCFRSVSPGAKTERAPGDKSRRPCRLERQTMNQPKRTTRNAGRNTARPKAFKSGGNNFSWTPPRREVLSAHAPRPGGGIGRRSRLKIYRRKSRGFDSHPGHSPHR